MIKILIVVLLLQTVLSSQNVPSKVVKTAQGPVRGYKSDEGVFYVFYGIPYATAPGGRFRYRAPLPGPVWLETFEATDRTTVCPQNKEHLKYLHKNPNIKENCLVANVYVPDISKKNLPVVVFIHGGAYQLGYGDLKTPKALVQQGKFIAVNFNYRLGVHGFLCLGTKEVPGNAGMKDMLALLKWVKKNIANFGGNPNDVTLDGYSAGSSAAELMLLSKGAKGLFNKVITESGAATSIWSIQLDPFAIATTFANKFDVKTNNVYELEDFYTTATYDTLTSDEFSINKDATIDFVPCVERAAKTSFISDSPLNILKKKDFSKLPNLAGHNVMEGILKLDTFNSWKDKMNEKFSDFLPGDLIFKSEEEKDKIASEVKAYYFGDKPISDNSVTDYIDYFGDILFKYSISRSIRLQIEAQSKVYLYDYSFYDDTSTVTLIPKTYSFDVPGAAHSAQTFALLEVAGESEDETQFSEEYRKMKSLMRDVWINFVKTGRPVSEVSETFPKGWPAATGDGSPHIILNLPPKLKGPLFEEKAKFWDQIYEKYYRQPIPPPKPPIRHSEL